MTNQAPGRRRVGGDVYLTPLPPGAGAALRVDVGFAPPGWRPRRAGRFQRAAFPGTALEVDGRWYEVVAEHAVASGRTAYDLAPWDDAEAMRTAVELTPETCDALTRRHRQEQARRRRGAVVGLAPVLTGLLPAADQKRLERELGVPAVHATMISASTNLALAVAVLTLRTALRVGVDFGELQGLVRQIAALAPLAAYLLLETFFRLQSVKGNEPMGSLPVALPLHVWRALRGLNVPREELDAKRAARSPSASLLAERDRVRPDPRHPGRLLVTSRLPKEHWTANVTGIEHEGETYVLVEREVVQTPGGPRHRFVLEKPEHETLFRTFVRYRPEEVRDVYREQQRAKSATWVETFAVLWGLFDTSTQERLARLYRYHPETMTRRAVFWTGALGALLAVRCAGLMASGDAGCVAAAGLVAGVVLVWESALRYAKEKTGHVPASLLGVLLGPLARRFLRWE